MRRNCRGIILMAALLSLVMLLCSFPIVYAEDAAAEMTVAEQENTPATEPESVMVVSEPAAEPEPAEEPESTDVPDEEPETDPAPAEVQEEELAQESEPAEVREEEQAAELNPAEAAAEEPEPADVPDEEPETDPAPAAVPEEEPAQESGPAEVREEEQVAEPDPAEIIEEPAAKADPVEIPEEMPEESNPDTNAGIEAEVKIEEDADEEAAEDTPYEFDDDEIGSVSGERPETSSNSDTSERIEFTGTVDIELKNSEICYDQDVTLVARVSGADMDYRLVWEANDGSGWFAVASGEEYTFLLTPDIVDREYRVVLFSVC